MPRYFREKTNSAFAIIKDPLIGYVVGHGDNESDDYHRNDPLYNWKMKAKWFLFGRPFSSDLARRFSQSVSSPIMNGLPTN